MFGWERERGLPSDHLCLQVFCRGAFEAAQGSPVLFQAAGGRLPGGRCSDSAAGAARHVLSNLLLLLAKMKGFELHSCTIQALSMIPSIEN